MELGEGESGEGEGEVVKKLTGGGQDVRVGREGGAGRCTVRGKRRRRRRGLGSGWM